ncbi:protein of unknown function [Methylotuvimicrobium alcaliphilum 20Z]|uniref:Uncharacterized protein n=1 Tax=Methylotuvimicrobium alcaliphilum (strain DSM 19304 / NCIMB 14124 / VKM B-2133 / 20Z) TaxID=1091494 RepID=G4SVP1_META2|nr:protein of unknown function [Methylotuvimicrobium alcaliphilum 20Z]
MQRTLKFLKFDTVKKNLYVSETLPVKSIH